MTKQTNPIPDLIADIGGTNARFALALPDGRIEAERILSGADYPDLMQAAGAYLSGLSGPRPRRAAVAVATAISGDWIQFTNSHWSFSTEATRQELGLEQLLILNDFTALALSLPLLEPEERRA
ncbi:MAG: glucokinase, partial [Candidatus Competibacter sp.]